MSNKEPPLVDTVQMVGKRVQVIERLKHQNQLDVRQFSSLIGSCAAVPIPSSFGSCDGRTPDDIRVWRGVFVVNITR